MNMNDTALSTKNRPDVHNPETTRNSLYFSPRVDIFETDAELLVYADLPGVALDQIDLHYERGELVLKAHVPARQRPGQRLLDEYEEGDYFRVFRVHESIDAARIEAEYRQGVLIVHLPKEEQVKPKQVNIRAE